MAPALAHRDEMKKSKKSKKQKSQQHKIQFVSLQLHPNVIDNIPSPCFTQSLAIRMYNINERCIGFANCIV